MVVLSEQPLSWVSLALLQFAEAISSAWSSSLYDELSEFISLSEVYSPFGKPSSFSINNLDNFCIQ